MLYTICVLDRQQRIHKCGLLALIVRVRKTYLCVFYEFSRKLSLKRHEAETVIACLKKINPVIQLSQQWRETQVRVLNKIPFIPFDSPSVTT